MKKNVLFLMTILLLAVVTATGIMTAYLVDMKKTEEEVIVGKVDVEVDVFFEKYDDSGTLITYDENLDYSIPVAGQGTFTKFGVCKVNISDRNDIQFIENFRVDVKVYSDVDTYFRVAPYEQLTLTYDVNGMTREVATTQKEYMKFNYDPQSLFYDSRMYDGFLYCTEKVKRSDESTPMTLNLIGDYFEGQSFGVYESRYNLQIGFIIEAVQAIGGPQNSWGLAETPWGSQW
jgi:hypothetical protein